jgi:hypothetical protein
MTDETPAAKALREAHETCSFCMWNDKQGLVHQPQCKGFHAAIDKAVRLAREEEGKKVYRATLEHLMYCKSHIPRLTKDGCPWCQARREGIEEAWRAIVRAKTELGGLDGYALETLAALFDRLLEGKSDEQE